MGMERRKGFEGWYFKHQKGEDMLAFIPGMAESGPFVQMIWPGGARQFEISDFAVGKDVIFADDCRFSRQGCRIRLPGVSGRIDYGPFAPLASHIMGPFRFLPMECSHGVLSMAHSLQGSVTIDGQPHSFDGGIGYAEKDSGGSFPSSYLWLQCNDFPKPCSIMLAIAHIPFGPTSFRGCICAVLYRGREYRLASYKGVRTKAFGPEFIWLTQGDLRLELDIQPSHEGHPLRAPRLGQMSHTIRESCNAKLRARLWEKDAKVFDLESRRAAYEYVPDISAMKTDRGRGI